MLVVKLMGGFGNQMFQYAFARALENATGESVYFDITYFDDIKKQEVDNTGKDKNGVSIREYEIGIFPKANIKIATKEQIDMAKNTGMPTIFYKLMKMFKLTNYTSLPREKNAFSYHKEFFKLHNAYFEGYFQNENYYNPIINELRKIFTLPDIRENDTYNKHIAEKIKSAENPVFIHLRRDDYVKLGFGISDDYYRKAVKYIKEKVENPTFFVFCAEDPEYVQNEFDIGVDFELIGVENKTRETYFENMRHMKECKHAIVANSSYSWWAAYLMENDDKIVVAPSPWLNNNDNIICKNWVKISAQ